VFIAVAWQQRGEAMQRDERLVHGSALLGMAWRKHRFVYYCVIAGVCFDVIVLVWRKYAIILSSHIYLGLPSGFFPSGFPIKTLYAFFPMRST
jgi:hypothetical protein